MSHFGLTWSDVRNMPLRDFTALVEQMGKDIKHQNKGTRGSGRTPVMT